MQPPSATAVSANAAGVNAARFKIATIPKSAIPRDGSVSILSKVRDIPAN
jgi:hypothetical protein